jgi:hypothetical protein
MSNHTSDKTYGIWTEPEEALSGIEPCLGVNFELKPAAGGAGSEKLMLGYMDQVLKVVAGIAAARLVDL